MNEHWQAVPSRKRERSHRLTTDNRHGFATGPPDWALELDPIPNEAGDFHPSFLVLAGVPGSGKSLLSETLTRVMPWRYVRVNQDTLRSRQACILAAEDTIRNNKCPIIDRCNVSKEQRKFWINLAAQNNNVPLDCIVFDIPETVCVQRVRSRTNHPTLQHHEAIPVIKSFQTEWECPTLCEGFRSIRFVTGEASLKACIETLISQR
jgi:predicted kinase